MPATDRTIPYVVTPQERAEAERMLTKKFGPQRHLRIGFHGMITDDTRSSYNHGDVLCSLLHSVNPDIDIVNVGSCGDVKFPDSVLDCITSEIPLRLQIALIEQCDIMITVDSEFRYIASNLFRRPTILLLGPGDERCGGDEKATNVAVVRKSDTCKTCTGTCKTHCLRTVHPADIIHELAFLIDPSQRT
ncbi:MAG: glycosyltransferase family 9 protein [Candidatus Kapaibacterium sp.]